MYVDISYIVYLVISITLTIWVAHTLHERGAIFLVDAFHGSTELAASVNHLLVVGFYLINIGFVALALKTQGTVTDARGAIEMVSTKVGSAMLILGGMHFFNLYVLTRIRRRNGPAPHPPFAPDAVLRPVAAR